jgi:hypothetical protein
MTQINHGDAYNPPLKPGMFGYQYAEISPPQVSEMNQVQKYQGTTLPSSVPSGMQDGPGKPIMHYYRNQMGEFESEKCRATILSSHLLTMAKHPCSPDSLGHTIQTPLPPSHPAMQCLMSGQHVPSRHFGCLGIIMGVLFCPLGCIW